jgi:arsenate reductase
MTDRIYNVLILCTGNSARSIMGEGLFNHMGQGRFKAYSAGSQPAGQVNPFALRQLQRHGIDTTNMRSKSWDEFAGPEAPQMDFVFTVCDNAAGEACPLWPGAPMRGHWGFSDPAAVGGSDEDKQEAFMRVYTQIKRRIELFLSLPLDSIDRMALKTKIDEIGQSPL